MYKFNKFIAFALAATMVVGSSVTAFADDPATPVTSVDSTGDGTSEGHVEKKKMSVTLPTTAATTFAYTMDPERLIAETAHERLGDNVILPEAADDTGVYFNRGPKGGDGDDAAKVVYSNSSSEIKVVNKSSHKIALTVKAEAISDTTDISLVGADEIADAESAALYLGLVVGNDDGIAVSADAAATKTVEINGTLANYKVAYDASANDNKGGYVFRALTLEEYKKLDGNEDATLDDYDATWADTTFKLEGAVTEGLAITSTTTAPQVKVTWSWADPDATPSITLNGTYSRTANNNSFTLSGIGANTITGVVSYMADGTTRTSTQIAADAWSVNSAKTELVIDGSKAPFGSGAVGQNRGIGVKLSDGTEIKVVFEIGA